MSLKGTRKNSSNFFLKGYILFVVFTGCFNNKKNNYTEFDFISRYTNKQFNFTDLDTVKQINYIIENGEELKNLIKYPGYDYMIICKKDNKIIDTIYVTNFELMYNRKYFKSKIGILDYLKIDQSR